MTAPTITPMSDEDLERLKELGPASGIYFQDPNALPALIARVEAAEAELARSEDLTWFWEIADKDGLTGIPSDEPAALRILVDRAARATAAESALSFSRSEVETLRAALKPFAEAASKWVDTRLVRFDDTVVFGHAFDFDAWDAQRWEMHVPGAGSYAVWPSYKTVAGERMWSMYGGPDGVLALHRYSCEEHARSDAEGHAESISASAPRADQINPIKSQSRQS